MAATSYYGDREAGAQGSSQPAKGIVSGVGGKSRDSNKVAGA